MIIPKFSNKLFIIPVEENKLNATEYTSTQLMKFGSVVNVCTNVLNYLHLISFKKIANPTGRMDVAIPRRRITNVFFIT